MEERLQFAKEGPVVVATAGFIYDVALGRVICSFCGKRAYARNEWALALWESAHSRCCRCRQHTPEALSA